MNSEVDAAVDLPLAGCTVLVTREERGELGRLLSAAGAEVAHLPLIEIAEVEPEAQRRLSKALRVPPDWVVVTSAAGAQRVGAVAEYSSVRLAAVGTVTAQRLAEVAGRPVDMVPSRQLAASLIEEFARTDLTAQRIVIAQADRAGDALATGLTAAGHHVEVHTAYRTLVRHPSGPERNVALGADAVVFASGSAVDGWAQAFGPDAARHLPPIVVAIGPTTAGVAARLSLKVTHVAADHSLAGMLLELSRAWGAAA